MFGPPALPGKNCPTLAFGMSGSAIPNSEPRSSAADFFGSGAPCLTGTTSATICANIAEKSLFPTLPPLPSSGASRRFFCSPCIMTNAVSSHCNGTSPTTDERMTLSSSSLSALPKFRISPACSKSITELRNWSRSFFRCFSLHPSAAARASMATSSAAGSRGLAKRTSAPWSHRFARGTWRAAGARTFGWCLTWPQLHGT